MIGIFFETIKSKSFWKKEMEPCMPEWISVNIPGCRIFKSKLGQGYEGERKRDCSLILAAAGF